jgi:3-isopropylmalate/(R)-2-methylmalate dehydratase small subunit
MQPFISHSGVAVGLRRSNVDTDQIIPKQFLKRIERSGFGAFLFYDWRRRADGSLDPDFELNRPEARQATILIAGANFGCGSSREHAPWALADFGFRVIIAPSFADIFYGNCCQNGLLPVVLPEEVVDHLLQNATRDTGYALTVDLNRKIVSDVSGNAWAFEMVDYRRDMLLQGLDEIGSTLLDEALIRAFEDRRAAESADEYGLQGAPV